MTLNKNYYLNYTLGSYADAFMSMPIGISRGVSKSAGFLCDKINCELPEFFEWDKIAQKSPTYQKRETLRDKLDTEPGMKFLQSNVIGSLPFFLIGMPAAEGMQRLIEQNIHDAPEIVKYVTNSLGTLAIQILTGYSIFMANEVRTNKPKYVNEKGKLSLNKIGDGCLKAVKAFWIFDLGYIGLKTVGQSTMLALNKSPAVASAIADTLVNPIWYTVAIPLALSKGLIQTREMKK